MLRIEIPINSEGFDETTGEFVEPDVFVLDMEHSLVSLSQWESKWHKSFINTKTMTDDETMDYIKFMTLTENVPDEIYTLLTAENVNQIVDYIAAPMTATTFYDDKTSKGGGKETVTAELIYYWMIALNIPFECQYWHLNRLLTLVRVCNVKNAPPKKRSKREIMSRNAALNAQRRAQLNTKG